MIASRSLLFFRVDRVLKLTNSCTELKPLSFFQGYGTYHVLNSNKFKMAGRNEKHNEGERSKKLNPLNPVWRRVTTQASSYEEPLSTVEVETEAELSSNVKCSASTSDSSDQIVADATEAVTEVTERVMSSSGVDGSGEGKVLEGQQALSIEKHSISVEVGASLIRFIKGKGGSTQKKIEEEVGVTIVLPSSRKEDSVVIEGVSVDSVAEASARIQAVIDQAVNSPSLEYSHFISLPLAIHPELVDKLVKFQNSILGGVEGNIDSDSNDENSGSEDEEKTSDKGPNVAVKLNVGDEKEGIKVNITNVPLVSYAPKSSKPSAPYGLGIEKSIFIKPKTFHLTVLMLKLWNKERVNAAAEVLQSISSQVMDALDNQPISIRLRGLDCMRGSLAKARVVYAPVEEIGGAGRLLRACPFLEVIIDAYVKAGLVLEKDANHSLKLHATVMNARHRKRTRGRRTADSFDARSIFKQYGSQDWGEYVIREAHLSQRFKYDANGYYHRCASIPFPENTSVE